MRADQNHLDAPSIARAQAAFERALRDLVEACSVEECWRLHRLAPSSAGWRHLASCDEAVMRSVCRDGFGALLDIAIVTLSQAIDDETDGARRVVMASWLTRLAE